MDIPKAVEDKILGKKEEAKKVDSWRQAWRKTWKRILGYGPRCLVCGNALKGSPGQVVKYCSKRCRTQRHNRKYSYA